MLREDRQRAGNSGPFRSAGGCGHKDSQGYCGSTQKIQRIVLAGNPNVGKSVIFHRLTGIYNEISNYPGTTLDMAQGTWQGKKILDSPGIYGLSGSNDEERLAGKILTKADLILNVVDATQLHRDLFLTQQLLALGKPVVIALNMMDEARKTGIIPNYQLLAQTLGCPVVPMAAVKGEGLGELTRALGCGCRGQELPELKPEELRQRANSLARACAATEQLQLSAWELMLTRPFPGFAIMLLVLGLVWWLLGSVVATRLVAFSEGLVLGQWLAPLLASLIDRLLPAGLLKVLVIGEFGLVTMALVYSFGLLLPLVFSFYLLLAFLEDTGYLPRVAVLLDNMFSPLGLNGKAVIPLILGFGCVTMAAISTRMLGSRRERLILTFLLGLAVPCSAQTGIIAMLLVPMGLGWLLLYSLILVTVFLVAGRLLDRLMPGEAPGLYLELPKLRVPRPGNLFLKSGKRSWSFLKEALPIFCLGAMLITLLDHFGLLFALGQLLSPLTTGWLLLPSETVSILIMGMIRRDFGTAGLYALALPPVQMFTALVTMTLFVPCLATVLVVVREQGWLTALLLWLGSLTAALLVGGLVAQVLMMFS